MRRYEESNTQRNAVKWFRLQYPNHVLFSIPNGGRRDKTGAAILKSEGLLAGVADLFLAYTRLDDDGIVYHGLFIELKSDTGRQSKSQKLFERNIMMQGYDYSIVRNLDEFINVVNNYLK